MSPHTPFQDVYLQYHRRARDYARQLVDDPNDAEDLAQDTFLKAFAHYDQLRDEKKVESWLFQIMRNNARMSHRRFHPHLIEYEFAGELQNPAADVERTACCRERLRRVHDAIRRMPGILSRVVVLRVFQERSSHEAGALLGVTEDVVKTRLRRARIALRQMCAVLAVLFGASIQASAQEPRHMAPRACALCHSQADSMPYGLWAGSMMANASKDPYWDSRVAEEKRLHPEESAAIDELCTRCHAPMQKAGLRKDGVGCTVCHQIENSGLGTEESFTGKFTLNTNDRIYGPHENPFTMPMLHHTGYTATAGKHILRSELCATCHTVITHGGFVEQGPYLEWKSSSYAAAGIGCADCHMPALTDLQGKPKADYIAHRPPGGPFPPTRPRVPVGQHMLVGGNVAISTLLGQTQTAARAKEMLEQAAGLEIRVAGSEKIEIAIQNLTGHRLPSGYPSRRMWLNVVIRDAGGRVISESGRWNPESGELEGMPPVRVFETRMADEHGRETFSLMSARTYLADTRIAVDGKSAVSMALPAKAAEVEVNLVYQSVSPRHAAGLIGGRGVVVAATATQKLQAAGSRTAARASADDQAKP